jgi:hypothetical protein
VNKQLYHGIFYIISCVDFSHAPDWLARTHFGRAECGLADDDVPSSRLRAHGKCLDLILEEKDTPHQGLCWACNGHAEGEMAQVSKLRQYNLSSCVTVQRWDGPRPGWCTLSCARSSGMAEVGHHTQILGVTNLLEFGLLL